MSLHPTLDTGVPTETAVARTAFPRGHAYLSLRDTLGPIYADGRFADQVAYDGQPAACPRRLVVVMLLHCTENPSDRSRLVAYGTKGLLFDIPLNLCRERGLLAKLGRRRTDAIHVLGAAPGLIVRAMGLALGRLHKYARSRAFPAQPPMVRAEAGAIPTSASAAGT